MESLLIIDDEPGIRHAIVEVLRSEALQVYAAADAAEGLRLIREVVPSVILLDVRLGLDSGIELFKQIREADPKCLVIFITGHGTTDTAIETMKLGAFDYLVKPLDFDQLQDLVDQALRIGRLMRSPASVATDEVVDQGSDRLIGSGPIMRTICKQIGRIAPQDVNVLIQGETGTGKELVARVIYQHSRRSQSTFLAINCAAIPEALLESELFGHEKGAFTNADRTRIGKFEQCHNGTIFLDEIGDMPLSTQAKILRVLQDGKFERVGGNETLSANVRIISATNKPLEEMIDRERFRRDLFYRLKGVSLKLPPLRDRPDDLAELAYYFLFRFNRQLGTAVQSIALEAIEKMRGYGWPGNIRQLQSVIREALILSRGPILLPEFLPLEIHSELPGEIETPSVIAAPDADGWQDLGEFVRKALAESQSDVYRDSLQRFDRLIITEAMRLANGFQSRAAELLSLSRPTVRAKLRILHGTSDESLAGGLP